MSIWITFFLIGLVNIRTCIFYRSLAMKLVRINGVRANEVLVWSCLYVWHLRPISVLIFMILLAKLEIANRTCIPLPNSLFSFLLYIDGSAVKVILSRNTPLFHTSRYLTWMDGRRQFRISRIAPRVSKVEQTASER